MIRKPYFSIFKDAAKQLVSKRILTGQCILCGGSSQHWIDFCEACEDALPAINHACHHCALPIYSTTNKNPIASCGQCQQSPPPFQHTIACWQYLAPLAQLISQYKHNHKLSYGMNLAKLAGPIIQQRYLSRTGPLATPDTIIAIPLHWRRYWQRGFNQSELLANSLSRQLKIPLVKALKRCRSTTMQQSLNAEQRQRNLHNAFAVTKPELIQGRRIALVDDVMTTGATATEAARTLLSAGANEVHIWVLARTPR